MPQQQMSLDFLSLPSEEKNKVLMGMNQDYAGLPQEEQQKVLNGIETGRIKIADMFEKGEIQEGSPEYTTAQQIYLSAKPYIKPTAEMAGMAGGAIAGIPVAPPFGSIGGAGIGYSMVQSIFKMTENMLGIKEPGGFVEELKESSLDIIEGATYEAGGQAATPIIRGAGRLIKKPFKRAADALAFTEKGGKKKAHEIFTKESRGTELTQPQIDTNIKVAKELESKLRSIDPEFRFTQGQLTNDASAISLERSLARKKGQDMSQEQREYAKDVLRRYSDKNVTGTGDVSDFVKSTERMSKELEASTKEAQQAVESEVFRLSGHVEQQDIGKVFIKNLSVGKAAMRKEANILYDKIPDLKLETGELSKNINRLIKTEDGIIEPRAKQMISLINNKILRKKPGKVVATINPATGKAIATTPPETTPIGYQVLRKLHSRVGKAYRASNSGANPNLEDARQLYELQGYLDDVMKQMETVNPQAAIAYKKATQFYKETYIPTFRQGKVADVLQRGARGEETKIAKANIAQAFDSLDGIDDLVRATGKVEIAKNMMKDYYSFDLINKGLGADGKVVTSKAMRWLRQNTGKLKKLGLYEEFKGLPNLQRKADNLIKYRDVFNKSVAGKILEADVDKMITNAFGGSKNYGKTAGELMQLVEGNKAGEAGLKKAFAEMLMRESEATVPAFFQAGELAEAEFLKTTAKLTKQVKKYLPAMRVFYRNEPEKQKALMDVYKAYQTLERTARSPIGGGSDTMELTEKAASFAVATVRPRAFYPFKVARDFVGKWGRANTETYLRKAIFDPEYAKTLLDAEKKGLTPPITSTLNRLMTLIAYETDMPSARGLEKRINSARGLTQPVQ